MPEQANPRMLTLVREAAGLTQRDLAEAVGKVEGVSSPLSQAFISKVESGILDLSGDNLVHVAAALDCPVTLLTDSTPIQGLEVTCVHHRRRQSKITAPTRRRIEAVTHLTRVSVEGLLTGIELEPETAIQRMDIDEYGDPGAIARAARAAWRVPSGPVSHVLRVLDAIGVVVVVRPLQTQAQDAVSSWPPGRVPLMVLTDNLPPDRQRFTICHELGHLLMHSVPGDEQEEQANTFAAEFLMPAADLAADLAGLTTRDLPRLLILKAKWGVSVAALIRRARDLETISERQYREFNIRLRRLGWHLLEPGTLVLEEPVTLQRVQQVHVSNHEYTVDDLAAAARMTPGPYRRYYQPPFPETRPPTRLRLVE